ncbi:MAG: 3-oxoacyl-[acyl-carrier-protein] reductase [Acidimicrobiia bacterium]
MENNNSEKVALVTGGSRGIGRNIVINLSKAGYKVAFSYSSDENGANETIDLASQVGEKPIAIKSDVSSVEGVDELFTKVEEQLGIVSILVNNAGITRDTLLMRMKDDQWDDVIQTNLTGAFYTMRRAARNMMKNRWGRIINISSVNAYVGPVGQANYAAAKSGIIGMSRSIAREFASRNITVNVIAPGVIETAMVEQTPQEWRDQMLGAIPLARFGTADDVAKAVKFLASDDAEYITGVVLPVDGGVGMGA